METLALYLLMQVYLAFGVAGLIWPERLMSTFDVLMFPWPASRRLIRTNGLLAIGAYLLLVGRLVVAL